MKSQKVRGGWVRWLSLFPQWMDFREKGNCCFRSVDEALVRNRITKGISTPTCDLLLFSLMDKTWLLPLPSKDSVIEVIEWIPNFTFFLLKLSCFLFPHFLKFSFFPQMSCSKRNPGWHKSKLKKNVCTANCRSAVFCALFYCFFLFLFCRSTTKNNPQTG